MIYTVDKIEEDLDYGCEERDENQPVMAVVTLVSPDGGSQKCKMPDHLLYERNISSGDTVIFDEDHFLRKPLSRNWTQECSGSGTNLSDFFRMDAGCQGRKTDPQDMPLLRRQGGRFVQ